MQYQIPLSFPLCLETVLLLSTLLSLLCQLGPEIHDTDELLSDSGGITGRGRFALTAWWLSEGRRNTHHHHHHKLILSSFL